MFILFLMLNVSHYMLLPVAYSYICEKTFCYGVQGGDYSNEVLKYPSAGASLVVLPHYARAKGIGREVPNRPPILIFPPKRPPVKTQKWW